MTTTEATPGQAFRATLIERWSARGRCVDGRSWDQLPKEDRDDLEAAADAALMVAIPVVATRLAEATEENTRLMLTFDSQYRNERDEARAELAQARKAHHAMVAQLASERDAHKQRADHYEDRWRAEHGLPPDAAGGRP